LDENDTQYGSAHYLNGDISTDAVIPSNNVNTVRKTVEELKVARAFQSICLLV
jgi:hypothetical protein